MSHRLITFENPKSAAAESFRTLRTNLQFLTIGNDIKSVLVTSSESGDGKSTILANLSTALAQAGKKTVLIDCDLRKPSIHKIFGLPNRFGLTNYLLDSRSVEDYVYNCYVENLYIITSGNIPPNPAELLSTQKMKKTLEELQSTYDIILVDSPPVLAVTDAQILSTITDGVIIIASYGKVEKQALTKTKDLLEKVQARILGVVLNKVPKNSDALYYDQSYYHD